MTKSSPSEGIQVLRILREHSEGFSCDDSGLLYFGDQRAGVVKAIADLLGQDNVNRARITEAVFVQLASIIRFLLAQNIIGISEDSSTELLPHQLVTRRAREATDSIMSEANQLIGSEMLSMIANSCVKSD